jgi:pepF/M3 family oligoendopeptidase
MTEAETWDLSVLYGGFDEPRWRADFHLAKEAAGEALAFVKGLPPERLNAETAGEALARIDRALLLHSKTATYANMLHTADSARQDALRMLEALDGAGADNAASMSALARLILKTGMAERLAGEPSLAAYAAFFRRQAELAPHALPEATEAAVLRLQQTGGQGWYRLRGVLEASMTAEVELDGEKRTLPVTQVRALFSSADPELRRRCMDADIEAGRKSAAVFAACLSGVKGEALAIAQMRGYESVLDWMLSVSRMKRATLDAMLDAIADALPAFRRFLKAKAKVLGRGERLAYCDALAPVGLDSRRFSLGEARRTLADAFSGVDRALARFADDAFERRWIDAMPRAGKQGGAMCFPLHTAGESRVFLNFDGSLSGVLTLAHELGHAWHDRCLFRQPFVGRDAPTPLCETASIFNETLVYARALEGAAGEERLFHLNAALSGAVQNVVDIYGRFLFEDEVMRRRAEGGLDADDLCGIMEKSQLAAYGDCLDPNALHPTMWVDKVHYYIPDFHYYNFPYAFGLLFARGLYAEYGRRPEGFFARYERLLEQSGALGVEEAGLVMGLDLTQKDFWEAALGDFEKLADEFERLAGDGCR